MTHDEIVKTFHKAGALLEGHFQLRSGLHSNRFFQAALLLQRPDVAERLCRELAKSMKGLGAATVVSPAIGGILVGHELARALGARAVFADKENDMLVLKRGFSLEPGEKVIVAEDVVTKGGRVQQTVDLVRKHGAEVVAVGVIADRSGGEAQFGVPFHSLIKLELATYQPESCPLCKDEVPLQRPGSKS